MTYMMAALDRQAETSFGEVPPGTSTSDRRKAAKSIYYLYTLATMTPVFRAQGFAAAGVGAAGVVAGIATGGIGFLLTGVAAVAAQAMIQGTANAVLETTLWCQRSRRDRDAYINGAWVGNDVKDALRKAARRMDAATKNVRDASKRRRARARAYFEDFIAVGNRSNLKALTPDQRAAFGLAYLQKIADHKSEAVALEAGAAAAAAVSQAQAQAQARGNAALEAKRAKEKATAIAAAKQKAKAELEQKAKDAAKRKAIAEAKLAVLTKKKSEADARRSLSPMLLADMKAAQDAAKKAQADEATALQQSAAATKEAIAAIVEEKKLADVAAIAAADAAAADAAAAPPPEEKAQADEEDSAEDKVADAQPPPAKFPVVPALAVAGVVAVLLLRKK